MKSPATLMIVALLTAGPLAACLTGCATGAAGYDDRKVALIQRDSTTEAELLQWFGPPTSRMLASNGAKTLNWKFPGTRSANSASSGTLDVRLSPEGKVSSYSASGKGQK